MTRVLILILALSFMAILNQFGQPYRDEEQVLRRIDHAAAVKRDLRAKYDAAATTHRTAQYWAAADGLSANAANSPEICRRLRYRSRYEFANNGSLQRMGLTLANDMIGAVPRLQLRSASPQANTFVEKLWRSWAHATHLGGKLRIGELSILFDGAALAVKTTNPGLAHPVKLDVRMLDYDRLSHGVHAGLLPGEIDGIDFDAYGNPTRYHILKEHPGDVGYGQHFSGDAQAFDARYVIHFYNPRRPEQERGIPEVTPVLNLFAQRRRYTEAVLTAAELAAMLAGVLKTNGSAIDPAEAEEVGDSVQIEMGHLLTLPRGWDINQMRAEQPTTTFASFNDELLKDVSSPFLMPMHSAGGDYSKTNYSSGRLGNTNYRQHIKVGRNDRAEKVLDPLLVDFLTELALYGLMPELPALTASETPCLTARLQQASAVAAIFGMERISRWLRGDGASTPTLSELYRCAHVLQAAGYGAEAATFLTVDHEWFFDEPDGADDVKDATGAQIRIRTGTSTLTRECAERGRDIDALDAEAARENGVTVEVYRQRRFAVNFPEATQPASSETSTAPPQARNRAASGQNRNRQVEAIADQLALAAPETLEAIEELLA